MFRVIVAGSRDFHDYSIVEEKLDYLFSNRKPDSIVCGGARGADELGAEYAKKHGIKVDLFPADWDTYGKSAGYIRNTEMAKNAEALVAFWDGKSRGTAHIIETAKAHGLAVRVIKYEKTAILF